jgi:hypothetical protein
MVVGSIGSMILPVRSGTEGTLGIEGTEGALGTLGIPGMPKSLLLILPVGALPGAVGILLGALGIPELAVGST